MDGKITVQENKFNITLNITPNHVLERRQPKQLSKRSLPASSFRPWMEVAASNITSQARSELDERNKLPALTPDFASVPGKFPRGGRVFCRKTRIFDHIWWFKHIQSRISRGFFVKSMEWNWSQNHKHDSDDGYAISPRFFFGNQLHQQKRLCLKIVHA